MKMTTNSLGDENLRALGDQNSAKNWLFIETYSTALMTAVTRRRGDGDDDDVKDDDDEEASVRTKKASFGTFAKNCPF